MKIFGLNVGSNSREKNGRGWIDPGTGKFSFLCIEEQARELRERVPTYRELGVTDVKYPDLHVHVDPEFDTFTYGHIRRFGDAVLWKMQKNDILFFYATLDLLPDRDKWGVYVIGHFVVDHLVDARRLSVHEVLGLKSFHKNAHLKRRRPGVDLLVKGSDESRYYGRALRLSHPDRVRLPDPKVSGLLTSVTGKPIKGPGWHRWLLYSDEKGFRDLLLQNP